MNLEVAIRITTLILASIITLAFLLRSIITGEDLPDKWSVFLGYMWGILFGVSEVMKRIKQNGKEQNGQTSKQNKNSKKGNSVEDK